MSSSTRRQFLTHSSATLAAASLLSTPRGARQSGAGEALGGREIRIALVGCGGRGAGAAVQALSTAGAVKLVAVADAFEDRLNGTLAAIKDAVDPARVDVPAERQFVGFDGYERAMAEEVDLVLLATPPGFRPMHFEHAVARGKHVFMEKPVAVDGPGIRKVLAAGELATQKGLKVGVGLQRRHQRRYLDTLQRVAEGAIGDIVALRCYWNSGGVWERPREAGQTEMEYQMRNWYYFNWLCGDHIVEQHIHNLDVCNWLMGDFPARAQGQGGRLVRDGKDNGEIFDHHMVEYTYPNGTPMFSQCRHQPGTWTSVSEHAHGSAGQGNLSGTLEARGGWKWSFEGDDPNPYQVEHDDLFRAVREGQPYNEAEFGAKSTLTAIMGRMATYSGKTVSWEDALNSQLALVPNAYTWEADPPSLPDADGRYPIATPGKTRAF